MCSNLIEQATRCYKGGGGITYVQPAAKPPVKEDTAAKAYELIRKAMLKHGYESTILTSGMGVYDPRNQMQKSLLGA